MGDAIRGVVGEVLGMARNLRRGFLLYSISWLLTFSSPFIFGFVHKVSNSTTLFVVELVVTALAVGFFFSFGVYYARVFIRLLASETARRRIMTVLTTAAVAGAVGFIAYMTRHLIGFDAAVAVGFTALSIMLFATIGYPVYVLARAFNVKRALLGAVLSSILVTAFIGGLLVYNGLGIVERKIHERFPT